MEARGIPCYEQQVRGIKSCILDVSEHVRVSPESGALSRLLQCSTTAMPPCCPRCSNPTSFLAVAVSPDASYHVQGAAVCQAAARNRPTAAQHTAQQQGQSPAAADGCLPELQQHVRSASARCVEAQVLPFDSFAQDRQPLDHAATQESIPSVPEQQAVRGSPWLPAVVSGSSASQLNSSNVRSNSSSSSRGFLQKGYQPNSWIHPDLQLFLHELQQDQWTASAAAAAAAAAVAPAAAATGTAETPMNSSQQHQQQQRHAIVAGAVGSLHLEQQLPLAAVALFDWLAEVHSLTLTTTTSSSSTRSTSSSSSISGSNSGSSIWLSKPGRTTHPNIQPLLHAAVVPPSSSNSSSGSGSACLLVDCIPTDAATVLRHSPAALGGDWHLRFLLYQLLHALADLHARGYALGGFSLCQLRLLCPGWVQLMAKPSGQLLLPALQQQQQQWRQGSLCISEPCYTLPQLTEMWRRRVISNFEYLMWVNAAAGRRWGDRQRHLYLPWVLDFSRRPELDASGRVTAGAFVTTICCGGSTSCCLGR
jgi:hypothetical protein